MQSKKVGVACAAACLAMVLSASSCGSGNRDPQPSGTGGPSPSAPSSDAGTRDALNAYFAGLRTISAGDEGNDATGLAKQTETEPYDDSHAESGKRRYQCSSTPYRLTKNPDKIVTLNPDANKLWLGSLLQGAGYAGGLGSLRELPIRQRAPINVYMDLLGEDVVREVANPTPDSTQAAIGDLVEQARANGTAYPTRVSFEQVDANSSEESLLKLGFSVRYLSANVTSQLESSRTAQESSVTATFIQRLFTVSTVTPQSPADYFTSDFTMDDIKEQEDQGRVALDNPPVVVANVAYGRILLYNVTAKATKSELSGALSAAYNGGSISGSINLDARQQEILSKARYSVVVLGGDETAALNLIRDRKLGDYFQANSDLATAVPISYQVNNIGNDSAAQFSETTNYTATVCAPIANTATDVGDIIRVDNFRGYVEGPCGQADLYGTLSINGQFLWNQPKEGDLHPKRWTEFTFGPKLELDEPPTLDPAYKQTLEPGDYAMFAGDALHIQGSVLDANGIARPSLNMYDWLVPYPVAEGEQQIDGTSANCQIQLRFNIRKKADLYAFAP